MFKLAFTCMVLVIILIPELTDTFRVRIYVHIFLDSIYSKKVVDFGSLVY